MKGRSPQRRHAQRHDKHRHKPARDVLILFAKAPVPGQVKTRLCPPLSGDEAASLHGSMVLDMLEHSRSLKGTDRVLAASPSPDHPFFQAVASRFGIDLWEQTGIDLGARMASAFHTAFERGYEHAVIVGSDIPELTAHPIRQALSLLTEHDLVLGPTLDGGYYLIGMNRPIPELFTDIPWSTANVCSITHRKAEALGLSVGMTSPLRDLDTLEDLHHLTQALNRSSKTPISKRTAGVLRTLSARLANRQGTINIERSPHP